MKKKGSYRWFVYFIKERSVDVYEAGDKKGSPKEKYRLQCLSVSFAQNRRVKYASLLLQRASNEKELLFTC